MRHPVIILATEAHRGKAGVGLGFETDYTRTHNVEQGKDFRLIQELPGHESAKTTGVYTHVSQKDFAKFKNPFDDDFFDTS